MQKYIFILGKNPELSLLEIENSLPENKLIKKSDQLIILEFPNKLNLPEIQNKLGGTIKIGEQIFETQNIDPEFFIDQLSKLDNKKITFGFSLFNIKNQKQFFKLGLEIKKLLKQKNIKVRFVSSKESDLSSVIVQKEILNKNGLDFLIIKNKDNKYIIGITKIVQDFKKYSKLDYGRPARDPKSGMLPPKIAKIMINITNPKKDSKILDPFCGSGTILQEATLLGYKNVYASDISQKAIDDTSQNSKWLNKNFKSSISDFQIKKADASKLSQTFPKNYFDAIISEVYLGPSNVNKKNIQKIKNELQGSYEKIFKEFKKILKPDAKLVIAFPAWKIDNKIIRLNIKQKLFHKPIIYGRPDARVLREIYFIHE